MNKSTSIYSLVCALASPRQGSARDLSAKGLAAGAVFALTLVLGACTPTGMQGSDAAPTPRDLAMSSGDAGLAISACQTATDKAAAKCSGAGDTMRACFFAKYRDLCQTERADAITAAMNCFTTSVCHTFGDPGETAVASCLHTSYAMFATAATMSLDTALCSKCPGMNECPTSNMGDYSIPPQHLSGPALTTLLSCVSGAAMCSDVDTCYTTQFPALTACFK